MQHITGVPRNQMRFTSLEDSISQENPVRFIEAFVENISLKTLGFSTQTIKAETKTVISLRNTEHQLAKNVL